MTNQVNNQSIESATPTEFTYRGLVFKIHCLSQDHVLVIKQGNRIVSRITTIPSRFESDVAYRIQSIKEMVDKGYGLNIDYDKVMPKEGRTVVVFTITMNEDRGGNGNVLSLMEHIRSNPDVDDLDLESAIWEAS